MHTDTEAALGATWVVDPESSSVGFTIAHFGVATVNGSFGTFAGTLADNRGVPHANGTVDPGTVDTRNPSATVPRAEPSSSTLTAGVSNRVKMRARLSLAHDRHAGRHRCFSSVGT
jgi:hypothetical protein